jgi:hypothetical protein
MGESQARVSAPDEPRHVPRFAVVRAPLPVPDAVGRAHAGPLGEVFAG